MSVTMRKIITFGFLLIVFSTTNIPANAQYLPCCKPPTVQNEIFCPGECYQKDSSPKTYSCTPTQCGASVPCIYGQCVAENTPPPDKPDCGNLGDPCCPTPPKCLVSGLTCNLDNICENTIVANTTPSPYPTYYFELCTNIPEDNPEAQKKCGDCLDTDGMYTAVGCINFSAQNLVASLLQIATGLGGGIALLLMVMAGFKVAMAAGDPKATQEGKDSFTSALVGLLVIIFSVVILQIVGVDIIKIPGF